MPFSNLTRNREKKVFSSIVLGCLCDELYLIFQLSFPSNSRQTFLYLLTCSLVWCSLVSSLKNFIKNVQWSPLAANLTDTNRISGKWVFRLPGCVEIFCSKMCHSAFHLKENISRIGYMRNVKDRMNVLLGVYGKIGSITGLSWREDASYSQEIPWDEIDIIQILINMLRQLNQA